MKQCKCEHWQQCPTCMPHRFDTEGNLLPIPPTPLQEAQAQVKALTAALFQAQEAAKALAKREWQGLTEGELRHLWETIYDHGNGKYQGEASKAQREKALAIIEAKLREKNAP